MSIFGEQIELSNPEYFRAYSDITREKPRKTLKSSSTVCWHLMSIFGEQIELSNPEYFRAYSDITREKPSFFHRSLGMRGSRNFHERGSNENGNFWSQTRGGPTLKKSRNYLFLGKFFKFQGGSGPPVPPSGSAHDLGIIFVKP